MPDRPSAEWRTACLTFWQDDEKVRQLRSRIAQTLNVPQRVRLSPSLAAALLNGLFEHPAGVGSSCPDVMQLKLCRAEKIFPQYARIAGRPFQPGDSLQACWYNAYGVGRGSRGSSRCAELF
jgi:hypothetical protein